MRLRPSTSSLSSRKRRSLLLGAFVVLSLAALYACLPDDPAWAPRYDYAPDPEASVIDASSESSSDAESDADADADGGEAGDAADADAGDADLDATDAPDE